MNLKRKITITTEQTITVADLLEYVSLNVNHEEIPLFIARLDQLYEDWDVTERLMGHFAAVKEVYDKVIPKEEQDFKIKKLC